MSWFSAAASWWTGHIGAPAVQANLIDPANALPRGYAGSGNSGSVVTLATAGTGFAGAFTQTVVLTETRRYKCTVQARYQLGTTTGGRATVQAAYNSGSSASPGSATVIGAQFHVFNNSATTGINGADSGLSVGDVLLTPGTYTFYALVTRQNGGSATDAASSFYVLAEDIAAS